MFGAMHFQLYSDLLFDCQCSPSFMMYCYIYVMCCHAKMERGSMRVHHCISALPPKGCHTQLYFAPQCLIVWMILGSCVALSYISLFLTTGILHLVARYTPRQRLVCRFLCYTILNCMVGHTMYVLRGWQMELTRSLGSPLRSSNSARGLGTEEPLCLAWSSPP